MLFVVIFSDHQNRSRYAIQPKTSRRAALPFFSEMWERFGFYLLLAILQLYLTDAETGGWAMDRSKAVDIFGTFIAFVYLTPFVGGLLADRKLGYTKSVIIGGICMGIGYIPYLAQPHHLLPFAGADLRR